MPEALTVALSTPGLTWMAATFLVAGLVRGFTGFGSALIFVPVATQFIPMVDVITIIVFTGIASATALLPRAWSKADHSEVSILVLATLLTVPIGYWILGQLDPVTLRWVVAGIVTVTLAAVITGWRYEGRLGLPGRLAIGGGAGIVGGLSGMTGPVVIIFYLANARRSVESVRANTILFLAATDVIILCNLLWNGEVRMDMIWVSAILCVPYLTTAMVGQALFRPSFEGIYRMAAYSVIGIAVISGLPVLD